MAAKKKGKKGKKAKKAQKKARKAAKRAAKRAAKLQKKTPKKAQKKTQKKTQRKARKKAARVTRKAAKAVKKAARKARAPKVKARQQPESLRLRSAGPSFTVDNLDKSVAFYRNVLGFTQKDKWEDEGALKGVELLAGSVHFWLGQDDWKKGRNRVKGEGFRIYCGTTQDIDSLAARVRAAGVTLAEEPKDQSWGGRDFAVRDPDGFLITISSGL